MGPTDGSVTYAGWNIDDVEIWAVQPPPPPPGPDGTIMIGDETYTAPDTLTITVADGDLQGAGTASVTLESDTETTPETVTLTELGADTGVFRGTIDTTAGAASADGLLQVSHGDTVTATYIDADDGQGGIDVAKTDTAVVDLAGPIFAGLESAVAGLGVISLSWSAASDPATPITYNVYRATSSGGQDFDSPIAAVQGISYADTDVQDLQMYYYVVRAEDGFGNEETNTVEQAATAETQTLVVGYDLDTDPGWSTEGEWEFGQPTGQGFIDPTSGYTGPNVYGYNLYGDYANDLPVRYLTTTSINCEGCTNVELRFYRWLCVENSTWDHASVEVSNDGAAWTTVWAHEGGDLLETEWTQQAYDISAVAGNEATVYIRWGMGPTDGSVVFAGWNIDDVEVWAVQRTPTSPYAPSDLGPPSVVSGGAATQTQPTLQFTQSDPQVDDTVAYRIQIDGGADFSSPEVDYTSSALSQGPASFTVGQAAGSGTYAAGSEGQALTDGPKYWRVRSIDGDGHEGPWAVPNRGDVGFIVDTTDPAIQGVAVTSDRSDYLYDPGLDPDTGGTVYFNSQAGQGAGQTLTVSVTWADVSPTQFQGGPAFGDTPAPDTEPADGWTQQYTVEELAATQAEVTFVVTDEAGRTDSLLVSFVVDNDAPSSPSSVECHPDGPAESSEYDDDAEIYVTWLGGEDTGSGLRGHRMGRAWPPTAYHESGDTETGVDGVNTFYVIAVDNVGNPSAEQSASDSITIDLTDPVIESVVITSDHPGSFYSGSPFRKDGVVFFNSLAGAGAGQVLTVQVLWQDAHQHSLTAGAAFGQPARQDLDASDGFSVTYSVPTGSTSQEHVPLTVQDLVGRSATSFITFAADNVAPSAPGNVTCHPDDCTEDGEYDDDVTIFVSWTDALDGISGIREHRMGTSDAALSNPVHVSCDTEPAVLLGLNTFYVFALDNVGNLSLPGTDTIAVSLPDLIVTDVDTLPPTFCGAPLTIGCTVENPALISAPAFSVAAFLSADEVLDAGDAPLGSHAVAGLDGEQEVVCDIEAVIPASAQPGSCFVLVRADSDQAVPESNEDNNDAATAIEILAGADLVVQDLQVPASVTSGEEASVTDSVVNQGTAACPNEFDLGRYLVLDPMDKDVLPLEPRRVAALDPEEESAATTLVPIPSGLHSAYYWLCAYADQGAEVPELDETNNGPLCVAVHIGGAGLADSAWPVFRHDVTRTGRSVGAGPAAPAEEWRTALKGPLKFSPVVDVDGTLYLPSKKKRLFALDSQGQLQWTLPLAGQIGGACAIGADGTIYFGTAKRRFHAINPDGTEKWTLETRIKQAHAPLVAAEGTVYVAGRGGASGYVYAIADDETKGRVKYFHSAKCKSVSTPVLGRDGTLYVAFMSKKSGTIAALTPSGAEFVERWTVEAKEYAKICDPALGLDELLYLGTASSIVALETSTGAVRWAYSEPRLKVHKGGLTVYPDGTVYAVTKNGLLALGPDGALEWRFGPERRLILSPIIDSLGVVYAAGADRALYAVTPAGEEKWAMPLSGKPTTSPILVGSQRLYIATKADDLCAIGPEP